MVENNIEESDMQNSSDSIEEENEFMMEQSNFELTENQALTPRSNSEQDENSRNNPMHSPRNKSLESVEKRENRLSTGDNNDSDLGNVKIQNDKDYRDHGTSKESLGYGKQRRRFRYTPGLEEQERSLIIDSILSHNPFTCGYGLTTKTWVLAAESASKALGRTIHRDTMKACIDSMRSGFKERKEQDPDLPILSDLDKKTERLVNDLERYENNKHKSSEEREKRTKARDIDMVELEDDDFDASSQYSRYKKRKTFVQKTMAEQQEKFFELMQTTLSNGCEIIGKNFRDCFEMMNTLEPDSEKMEDAYMKKLAEFKEETNLRFIKVNQDLQEIKFMLLGLNQRLDILNGYAPQFPPPPPPPGIRM